MGGRTQKIKEKKAVYSKQHGAETASVPAISLQNLTKITHSRKIVQIQKNSVDIWEVCVCVCVEGGEGRR